MNNIDNGFIQIGGKSKPFLAVFLLFPVTKENTKYN